MLEANTQCGDLSEGLEVELQTVQSAFVVFPA